MSEYVMHREVPKIWDWSGNKLAELHNAKSSAELIEYFGDIDTFSFTTPRHWFDANNTPIADSEGSIQDDPSVQHIKNWNLVEYKNKYYVITKNTPYRDESNKLLIQVDCKELAYELSKIDVEFSSFKPPQSTIANSKRAIADVLSKPSEQFLGNAVSSTSNTIVLPSTASASDDFYNGMKIVILDGAGEYQTRNIIDYVGSTRTITIDVAWSAIPNSTSLVRIYRGTWELGVVDAEFSSDLYSMEFKRQSVLDCLRVIATTFGQQETAYLDFDSYRDQSTGNVIKKVNLLKSKPYSGKQILYKKDLKSIRKESNGDQRIYTRIRAEGYDNLTIVDIPTEQRTDNGVAYDAHTQGQPYIYNFKYFLDQGYTLEECYDNFVYTYNLLDDVYVDNQDLYDFSKGFLNKTLAIEEIVYDFGMLDLSVLPSGEYTYEDFNVGDTVRVIDPDIIGDGFLETTVLKKTTPTANPQNISIETANYNRLFSDLFAELIKQQQKYADTDKSKGQNATKTLAIEGQSKNWRLADYFIPEGTKNAEVLINRILNFDFQNGGRLIILDGDIYISGTITPNSKTTIEGQGITTRIIPYVGSIGNTFTISGKEDIVIKNIFVDYRRDLNGVDLLEEFLNGINITSSSNNILVDSLIIEKVDNNMIIAQNSSNIEVKNSILKSESLQYDGTDCIDFKACNNATVKDCRFIGDFFMRNQGIVNFTTQVGDTSGDFYLEGCYFEVRTEPLVFFGASQLVNIALTDGTSCTVSDNSIKIINGGSSNSVITLSNSKNVEVTNNIIYANIEEYGINIVSNSTLDGIKVSGNSLFLSNNNAFALPSSGIYLDGSGTYSANIQNNTVKSGNIFDTTFSANSITYGIYSNGDGAVISGNNLKNSGSTSSFQDVGINTEILGGNAL